MADNSKIEWCDATWNVIVGCSVLSPGCTNCYAMRLAGTRLKRHPSRAGLTVESKAGPVWTGETRLDERALTQPLRWRRPRKIFVGAHTDLFHEATPDEWIDKVFAVMALCPQHTFQVLTKRPERMQAYMVRRDAHDLAHPSIVNAACLSATGTVAHPHVDLTVWPLPNVWLGVTAERQQEADERIPILLGTPAAKRFVSIEPMLGEVDLTRVSPNGTQMINSLIGRSTTPDYSGWPALDWVICGGESGPGARPVHPDWVRSLRDQCAAVGVAFMLKQWGEWMPQVGARDGIDDNPEQSRYRWAEWTDRWGTDGDYRWNYVDYPQWCDEMDPHHSVVRAGKRAAGRLLDGIEHNAFPEG